MEENKKETQIEYLTFASVISAFSVLILHTNGCFWIFSSTEEYWRSANIIESVFYFAVPVFFMISGITLIEFYEKYSLKQFFYKRIRKTVIPFLAWSIIWVIYLIWDGSINLEDISIKYLYQGIFGTSFVGIFWFFNALFKLYLCIPLFAAIDKSKRKSIFLYLVFAGVLLNNAIPFFKSLLNSDLQTPYNLPVVSNELIWLLLGWLIHNSTIKKHQKILIYVLAVFGLLIHIFGTYYLSIKAGKIVSLYKGYQNIPCILYSIGIFVLLKDYGTYMMRNNRFVKKIIEFLSGYTLSIYLMQFPFLRELPQLSFVDSTSLVYRLGAPFIIIPIIVFITTLLRMIPMIKHIVPK